MFPNFRKLYEAVNKVKNEFPDSMWDFSTFWDSEVQCGCFMGAISEHFNVIKIETLQKEFGMSDKVFEYLFQTELTMNRSYTKAKGYSGKHAKYVTKEEVCSLVERYTDFKLKQYHKWQDYEYKKFGTEVTNKRGVCI